MSGFFVLVRFAAFPAGFVAIATQAHRSACYHGIIASGAAVMRSLQGPQHEGTMLLCRASCFWHVVSSRRQKLPW
ncbi:hypothetical protein E0V91_13965 [Salmonella enterica subsp. enterica serovar Kambole]|nr:hypothetical protein [Salmonella enterica subsp. enterica serovar Everleigh]ECG3339943.1 hypothetical protein [Salmonella enterica subsp. enterica serovar Kambole]ECG4916441.1 hypothetical protein [Salmonella enterica subsp. enterica serovar Kambole]